MGITQDIHNQFQLSIGNPANTIDLSNIRTEKQYLDFLSENDKEMFDLLKELWIEFKLTIKLTENTPQNKPEKKLTAQTFDNLFIKSCEICINGNLKIGNTCTKCISSKAKTEFKKRKTALKTKWKIQK